MRITRDWATPLTAGAFILMAFTGMLMFFHLDRGIVHSAHEWLSFAFLLGATLHISKNIVGFKQLLSSRVGQVCILFFISIATISFFASEEKKGPPSWAGAVRALSEMPLADLSRVANINSEELRTRLNENGINVSTDDQSIEELVGPNLRKQANALKAVFPLKDEN